jgi:hypothetical protein
LRRQLREKERRERRGMLLALMEERLELRAAIAELDTLSRTNRSAVAQLKAVKGKTFVCEMLFFSFSKYIL